MGGKREQCEGKIDMLVASAGTGGTISGNTTIADAGNHSWMTIHNFAANGFSSYY
jgi:cysteine synthase